ncbi:MAG: hypothetical protein F6J95_002625 [Leptolyngbya sp. SIO1E4]|nr:hypothetical protein [Leptolyngbya sp. SIO1E4]
MALNPGDIAFVQYNADSTEDFAFVVLADIVAGEEILFTDNGWLADNSGFRTGEGTLTWTAPAGGIVAGTVVTITNGTTPTVSVGTVSETGTFSLSSTGDQIIAYQDDGTITPIAAINNEGAATFQADATSTLTSALPQGLVEGVSAVAINEVDNVAYSGPTTGDQAALQAALNDPDNWTTGDNVSNQTFSGSFTVSDGGGGTGGGGDNTPPNKSLFTFEQYVLQEAIEEGRQVPFTAVNLGGIPIAKLFDETYYLANNPDIAAAVSQGAIASGYDHFVQFGWLEGRNPSTLYDEAFYLSENQDVAQAVTDGIFRSGLQHYLASGHFENRDPSQYFDADDYLLNNPDVQSAIDQNAVSSGFQHFVMFGLEEGRSPDLLLFSERFYLAQNADVAGAVESQAIASGFEHYLRFGQQEGRSPSALFDETSYLSLNPGVAAAVNSGAFASGLEHYIEFGRAEGRPVSM